MKLDEISVVIPIKNDYNNLSELLINLNAFKFQDIHVVDSIECNASKRLCNKLSVKYSVFNWDGNYPKKRNWYLLNGELRDWVLFLDSDERITNEFYQELLTKEVKKYDGYRIKFNNTFMGKKLVYGDIMTKIPLIRKTVLFERIEEDNWSSFDMEIHEHPVIQTNRLGKFRHRIDHLERLTIHKYISKHNEYSDWEAKRIIHSMNNSYHGRRAMKYFLLTKSYGHRVYFMYAYFVKGGFIDGRQGLYLAKMKSFYFYSIYLKFLQGAVERK